MEKVEQFDVVVIGAGISGIAFARHYLEVHPACLLTILDAEPSIGGTWCASRSYEHFWTQSTHRTAAFSDATLYLPDGAPIQHGMFEAKHVTQYLETYVDEHCYGGQSLRSRIRSNHFVTEVERYDGKWRVIAETDVNSTGHVFVASKLVIASGRTSLPNMPSILNSEQYKGPFVHHRDFGHFARNMQGDGQRHHIAVVGGGKAAADMVYQSVKQGKNVSWIVRKSGEGPCVFSCPEGEDYCLNNAETCMTRASQARSPSPFMSRLSWQRWFHKTTCGRKHIAQQTGQIQQQTRMAAQFRKRTDPISGFDNLNFEGNHWWMTGPNGVVQHDDFWETISQNVHVYRNDIDHMTSDSLILDDGIEVRADAVLCGTGWRVEFPFLSAALTAELDLPHDPQLDSPSDSAAWTELLDAADAKILRRFPGLARPPPHLKPAGPRAGLTPLRLYRGIAPLPASSGGNGGGGEAGDAGEEEEENAALSSAARSSVAFLGLAELNEGFFRAAEAQALWTTAWFDGRVRCPPLRRARARVAYQAAFSRRRYPSRGASGDCLAWDAVAYADALLADVGVSSHRRRRLASWARLCPMPVVIGGWRRPCVASDLRYVLDEYKRKHRS